MPERYRVAILATGRIAGAHARGYQMSPRAELAAAADIDPAALDAFRDRFEIPRGYADYRELLETETPDLVSVCSHPGLHAPMTIEAARRGAKAVLCEKPIALSLGEADAMIDACRRAGTLLVVGHQRRFAPQYIAAKRVLDAGAIGPIRLVEAYGHHHTSLLVDGTHTIDMLRFFLDEDPVDWVFGQVDDHGRSESFGHPMEDAALAWISFRSGVRALFTNGGARALNPGANEGLAPPDDWTGRNYHLILLHGRDGRLEVDGDAPVEGRPWVRIHRGAAMEAVPLPWDASEEHGWQPGQPPPAHLPPFAAEIAEMIRCLEEGGSHPLRGESARDTLEILMAIYESSRRRGIVKLPFDAPENPLFAMREAQLTVNG